VHISLRLRTTLALVVIVLATVGAFVWIRHGLGEHWDDVDVGQCATRVPQVALASMSGTPARTPAVDCGDASAAYVVVSRSTSETDLPRWTAHCPDPTADAVGTGRIRIVSWRNRFTASSSSYGLMCLAPVLHVGRCYSTDRGLAVGASAQCLPFEKRVTAAMPGVTDLRRCSPATGLALTMPAVTYCEVEVPLPPELQMSR